MKTRGKKGGGTFRIQELEQNLMVILITNVSQISNLEGKAKSPSWSRGVQVLCTNLLPQVRKYLSRFKF